MRGCFTLQIDHARGWQVRKSHKQLAHCLFKRPPTIYSERGQRLRVAFVTLAYALSATKGSGHVAPSSFLVRSSWFGAANGLAGLGQQFNRNNPGMQGMPRMQRIKVVGTFVMADQTRIQMSTNTNQPIMVMTGPNTEVSVTGTATQDYLKSGVNVEFVAQIDKTHTVKEKVTKMLVISPTTDQPIGLYPPESATPDKKPGKGERHGPPGPGPGPGADPGVGGGPGGPGGPPPRHRPPADALGADSQGGDLFSDKPAKPKKNVPQFPGNYAVRGTIKMFKNGAFTVSVGRGPTVKAELASDATIEVVMSDFHAAQHDDKVVVNGFTNQAHPNMVMAESIDIELANPLTGREKHSTRPAKTPATASKAKKTPDDSDAPPADK